jgi:hypothetical protein
MLDSGSGDYSEEQSAATAGPDAIDSISLKSTPVREKQDV